jgi:NAD(P)H-dependent FMN reductase
MPSRIFQGGQIVKFLVLNGSPKKSGVVATLLRAVADGAAERHEVEWVDVYDLQMKPCMGCMKCRPDGECVLPEDDAHRVGRKIREADGLIVGTPAYWGNMSSQLKVLFDRLVPVFESVRAHGMPIPRHKGQPAVLVVACTAPWPFNFILSHSRTAGQMVKIVLGYAGYRLRGVVVESGTAYKQGVSARSLRKALALGRKL